MIFLGHPVHFNVFNFSISMSVSHNSELKAGSHDPSFGANYYSNSKKLVIATGAFRFEEICYLTP